MFNTRMMLQRRCLLCSNTLEHRHAQPHHPLPALQLWAIFPHQIGARDLAAPFRSSRQEEKMTGTRARRCTATLCIVTVLLIEMPEPELV